MTMTNGELNQLETLRAKSKNNDLEVKERAMFKVLERKAQKQGRDNSTQAQKQRNVFRNQPTTKVTSFPVRLTDREKAGLNERVNDICRESTEEIIDQLGSIRDMNSTKLIRAAIHLLQEHSNEEIIQAIKEVKLNMVR